ncbi:MAG: winged helix DNA-binding protein [Asgard group archaeon]|nr:winged helix DNA-binding protein [Asgard group archaeon]
MKRNSILFRLLICTSVILLLSILVSSGMIETTISKTSSCHEKNSMSSSGNFTVVKHSTYIFMFDVDDIYVEEEIDIENNQKDTMFLCISLNQTHHNLSIIDDNNIPLSFVNITNTKLLNISLESEFKLGSEIRIELRYTLLTLPILVLEETSYYLFQFNKFFTYFTNNYTLSVRLPEGCSLHEVGNNPPCIPIDFTKIWPNNQLAVIWEIASLEQSTLVPFWMLFDEPESPRIWGYVVGPFIGLILGASLVYVWMKRGSSKLEEEIEQIYLTKNQQILLKLINEKEGKITQQEIINITNFSKSKTSRNLTPLEENGLIIKEKWGREFKVSLTKKGEKVVKKIVAEELQNSEVLNQSNISKEEKTI